ncbi:unnamed protein product [Darwinula stevensoni]|uniref:Oplophorus-luciferin 2-monooxygenase non-catalytic subunit n=1 Tax=Darwinula stevensoni TaxID=69355 RepID=A0A7R9FPM9_9CRUS|nr:unnamed protein product [Darwinula stevensoni]CAG0897814.1 unnamed protein product [Darwinula stevensoni]
MEAIRRLGIVWCVVWAARAQNPCPRPEEIAPCVCIFDQSAVAVDVDCSDADTSDQIYTAFNDATWTFRNLRSFRMEYSPVRDLPPGVFGSQSFQQMEIVFTDISTVDPSALSPSADRLTSLTMSENLVSSFPFDLLPEMRVLTHLDLSWNALTFLPAIRSSSLEALYLYMNRIDRFDEGTWSLPNLKYFFIGSNQFSELPLGLVESMGQLVVFSAQFSLLGPLRNGSLAFTGGAIDEVNLAVNSISNLESGAISGLGINSDLVLSQNGIRELTEDSFRPILEVLSRGAGLLQLNGSVRFASL